MTRLRKTIALRLKESQNTAAQLTTFNEVDMSHVMALRSQYKDSFEKKHGVRLGFMGFFTKACVAALKELPNVNAEIEGDNIIYKNYYDIGVAVSTDRGLVVPVVRDADRKDVYALARALSQLSEKARAGKLPITDMQGGCFTISSLGGIGGTAFTPIINAPEVAILGVSRSAQRPVYRDGAFVPRLMLPLSLSYDHRVIDGAMAARFTTWLSQTLADPRNLLEAVP